MIHETIITTRNQDGTTHIAPMGVHTYEEGWIIAPFKPSTTLQNLQRDRCAVINMTDDVRVFAGCLTGRYDWPVKPAEKVDGFVLEQALAHIEVEVTSMEDDEQRPRFYCRAVFEANHAPYPGFNRARAAVIEAAILVSRLRMLDDEKIDRELAYLNIAIEKTAGEHEHLAWNWLMEKVDAYRKERRAIEEQL
ncbi:MAG: DUF447 domain-containing protein [Gammaproteobacteria bacterium]